MPPKPPSFRYQIEYAGFRLLGVMLRALPIEWASAFGGALVAWFGPKSRERHPRLLNNLAMAYPDMPEAEREKLARAVWRNLGYVLGEFFHMDEIVPKRLEVVNPEVLQAAAASGKGSVVCGSHQTNWEAASAILTAYGLNPLGVYHPMSNPFVDAYIKARRAKYYPGGLTAKRDADTPMAMMRHARQGGTAAFLIDQKVFQGLPAPFFGRPAPSTPFPAVIARQCRVPLILLTGERLPGVKFKVTCHEIPVPHTADKHADIFAATAAMQAALEQSIRLHPEQWMWTHSRWE